jgi:hypothetical protein
MLMENETCRNYSRNEGGRKIQENDGEGVFSYDML